MISKPNREIKCNGTIIDSTSTLQKSLEYAKDGKVGKYYVLGNGKSCWPL